jgi:hypothetical protein
VGFLHQLSNVVFQAPVRWGRWYGRKTLLVHLTDEQTEVKERKGDELIGLRPCHDNTGALSHPAPHQFPLQL